MIVDKSNNNFKLLFFERYALLILVLLWSAAQAILTYGHGIVTDGEAIRKIIEAKNLANSEGLSSNSMYLYLTEISLIFISIKSGLGYWFVVAIQLVLNLVALLYFYKFLLRFNNSGLIAFVGTLLLILCFPYQQYNSFLYTESIFFSLSIIYSCFLLETKKIGFRSISFITLFLIFLCITRPSGIFFVAATIVYLFFLLAKTVDLMEENPGICLTFRSCSLAIEYCNGCGRTD